MLMLATALALAGSKAYVSDQLRIALRSGQSDQQPIIRMLPSGTELEVLATDPGSGYSRVRTKDNVEGWVYTAHLMDDPAARDRAETAEKRVAELEAENQRIRVERQTQTQLIENAEALDNENKTLKSRVFALESDLEDLHHQNAALHDSTRRQWFLVGAGVLLVGVLLGLVIPRIRWRKKSSWGSL